MRKKAALIIIATLLLTPYLLADDFNPADRDVGPTKMTIDVQQSGSGDIDLNFGTSLGERLFFNTVGSSFGLTGPLGIAIAGEALRLGNGSAADHYITFDNGSSKQFGWDESESSLSTFGEEMQFRTAASANPPGTCGSDYAGQQWIDSDTGILYVCDTTNSRDKWLSVNEYTAYGEETASCAAAADPNSSEGCNLDMGDALGTDTATNLGFHLPYNVTVTGYGYSQANDTCTSGSFDVEVWGTSSASDDNNYSLAATIAAGLNGETHNSNALNVDLAGDQYVIVGLDNNCGQAIIAYNVILYYRYQHS